jgi:hypothetical protein
MKNPDTKENLAPAEMITQYIAGFDDWRGSMLARLRKLILATDPTIVEEWKWETPVFSHNGSVVACAAFKDHLKLNFFKGASLADPKRLFNAGLEARTSRGIDLHQGDEIDEPALKELLKAAVTFNLAGARKK